MTEQNISPEQDSASLSMQGAYAQAIVSSIIHRIIICDTLERIGEQIDRSWNGSAHMGSGILILMENMMMACMAVMDAACMSDTPRRPDHG